MLTIKNLKSGYNDAEILHGVTIDVKTGTINAIIGPNGSGKSTILKSIFNLCDTYSGRIVLEGEDITNLSTYELIVLGVGYVPQSRQIFSKMTVKENLEMGAFAISDRGIAIKNIKSIFKKFPILQEKKNQNAETLSGGQQQILAIARSLVYNPRLLLLDEPSLGLSPKAMKEIFEIIKKIKNEGVTVVLVEQNVKQAMEIADRTYVLESGRVVLEGGQDIINNSKIKDIYFG